LGDSSINIGGGEDRGASTRLVGGVGASTRSGISKSNTYSRETDIESRVSIIII
jgi:hypothetical protein